MNKDAYAEVETSLYADGSSDKPVKSQQRKVVVRSPNRLPSNYVYIVFIIICIIVIIALSAVIACLTNNSNSSEDVNKGLKVTPKKPKTYFDNSGKPFPYQKIRVPNSIVPSRYKISLRPDMSKPSPTFQGKVLIYADCLESTDYIVLHSKDLTIKNVKIIEMNTEISIEFIKLSDSLEQIYIKLAKSCTESTEMSIEIKFAGVIANRLDGFYLSQYYTNDGVHKRLGTTHMEPTAARRAFPCFDEPAFKANFTLEMTRTNEYFSLFNMPRIKTVHNSDGTQTDVFEESVKMSTYLVAFQILPNDYKNVSEVSHHQGRSTNIRVFAPKDKLKFTGTAVSVLKKVLSEFEKFFGVAYPLPKLDMVCVADFAAGAMENWGLIIYRYITMLAKEEYEVAQHQQTVAEVVSHEIAHQWFGNIVTMKWWSELWLNEGFATYAQYLGAHIYKPQWNMMDQFYLMCIRHAMIADFLYHSHPVTIEVTDPNEIESLFDSISYNKGASLIRMIEGIIGLNSLKEGLKIYLQTFRYSNAESRDLWRSLSEGYRREKHIHMTKIGSSPAENLTKVMFNWLEQMNFPLVTLTKIDTLTYQLSQERFLLYSKSVDMWKSEYNSPYNYTWVIPVRYITDYMSESTLIWLNMEKSKTFVLKQPAKWIKINYEQMGFYMQNYGIDNWKEITRQLKTDHKVFTATDRAGLMSDAFFLTYTGKLNISVALDMIDYLQEETEFAPWQVATERLAAIMNLIYFDIDMTDKLKSIMQKLVSKQYSKFPASYERDNRLSHSEILTRNAIYQFMILCEHPKFVQKFAKIFDNHDSIQDENLKQVYYQVGIMTGGEDAWKRLWKLYSKTMELPDQMAIRRALTSTKDATLLMKLLMLTLNSSEIRSQDTVGVIMDVARTPTGRDLAFIFIRRYWYHFEKLYKDQSFAMSEIVKLCNTMSTEYDYRTVKEFFESSDLGSGTRSSKQVLENIKSNIYWMKQNFKEMKSWLLKRSNSI